MLTLGISGGLDLISQNREYLFPRGSCHDAAAVLVEDGRVVAAIEEERLNRIKHTSKGPVNAIRFCLESRGLVLDDLDALVFYGSEETCAKLLRNLFYGSCEAQPITTVRRLVHDLLQQGLGQDIDDRKLIFVNHHLAHAISAYAQSGLPESLVFTVDGAGDGLCGSVSHWRGPAFNLLRSFPLSQSLGIFYDRVIAMIGYGFTEEYKVMGLAPYGNPRRYRHVFRNLYDLLPEGDYVVKWDLLETLYDLAPVRKKGEPITKEHIDIAAGLQESLEEMVFHVLSFYRVKTGVTSLCMAGGVAHNSTLNGKILYSGMFDEIFIQPASHDGGCAIGAALYPHVLRQAERGRAAAGANGFDKQLDDVYWGTDVGTDAEIGATLESWSGLLEVEYVEQVAARAARLIADGRVIGWVQGRSEFGPRALGNRSIVADPRPPENKDLINQMIKKREGYRPFAPSVLEEYTDQFFVTTRKDMRFPFMSFTLKVRPETRNVLGATTHVDDTARVQTVSRATNARVWELIEEFRRVTGVPVLLNTSFNNTVEPIVDSVEDAIVCFLTTDLHHLVVGNYLVSKRPFDRQSILQLSVSLPLYARLVRTMAPGPGGEFVFTYEIATSFSPDTIPITKGVHDILQQSSGREKLSELAADQDGTEDCEALALDLLDLWAKRVIILRPPSATGECRDVSDEGLFMSPRALGADGLDIAARPASG